MIPMNKLDLGIAIVLALSFVFGYRRGFVLQLVSFLGFFVAWLTAYLFYDDLAPWVGRIIPVASFISQSQYEPMLRGLKLEQYIIGAISFSLLLFAVKLGLAIAGHLLNLLARIPGLNALNRWSGGLLALVEAAALIIIVIQVLAILPNEPVQGLLSDSYVTDWSMEWVPLLFGKMKELPGTVI